MVGDRLPPFSHISGPVQSLGRRFDDDSRGGSNQITLRKDVQVARLLLMAQRERLLRTERGKSKEGHILATSDTIVIVLPLRASD